MTILTLVHRAIDFPRMASRCVFCDTVPVKWAVEHITPKWLHEHLGLTPQAQLRQGYAAHGEAERSREFASLRFVEGRVCAECNNGWMSRLENAAKPILVSLMEGHRSLPELSRDEATIVAKWTTKIAYLLANASMAGKPVPPAHLHALTGDDGQVLPAVGVFGYQCVYDQVLSHLQIAYWSQVIANGAHAVNPETPQPDAYKTVLQYRHLMLLVAHWPYPESALAIAVGLHVPLWPKQVIWPAYSKQRQVPAPSSLPIMKSFAEALVVFSP